MKTAEQLIHDFDDYANGTSWAIIAIVIGEESITIDIDEPARLSILKEALQNDGFAIGMAKFLTLAGNSIQLDICPLPEDTCDGGFNRTHCRGLRERLCDFLVRNVTEKVLVTGLD